MCAKKSASTSFATFSGLGQQTRVSSITRRDTFATSARPSMETIEPLVLDSGERLQGEIKYFDYGVVSVVFELPFAGDWDTLVQLSSRWVWDTDFEALASRIVKQRAGARSARTGQALPGMAARGLLYFSRARDCRRALGCRSAGRARRPHRPGRPRRNRYRCQTANVRSSAVANFLLSE